MPLLQYRYDTVTEPDLVIPNINAAVFPRASKYILHLQRAVDQSKQAHHLLISEASEQVMEELLAKRQFARGTTGIYWVLSRIMPGLHLESLLGSFTAQFVDECEDTYRSDTKRCIPAHAINNYIAESAEYFKA